MSRTHRRTYRTRPTKHYLETKSMLQRNPDTGQTIAWVALAGAAAFGAYMWWKGTREGVEGIPDSFKITKYKNLRTTIEATSGFLDVRQGDTVRVFFEYQYFGPALNGEYYVSLWQEGPFNTHDEVGPAHKPFYEPEYLERTKIEDSVDMEIKAGDGEYGLFGQIKGIPKGDVPNSPDFLTNRIRVGGLAPPGTYEIKLVILPSANAGSVSLDPAKDFYDNGEVVVLKAIPNSGYEFEKWSADVPDTTDNPISVKLGALGIT